jgi:hypothetical protein
MFAIVRKPSRAAQYRAAIVAMLPPVTPGGPISGPHAFTANAIADGLRACALSGRDRIETLTVRAMLRDAEAFTGRRYRAADPFDWLRAAVDVESQIAP